MTIWLFIVVILTRDAESGAWSHSVSIKETYETQTAEGDCKRDLYQWKQSGDHSVDTGECVPLKVRGPFR